MSFFTPTRSYPARTIVVAIASVVVMAAQPVCAEQKTIRIVPPPFQPGGCTRTNNPACGWASSEDPDKVVSNLIRGDVACTIFMDPTPPRATVTSIDVRFPWARDRTSQTYTVGLHWPSQGTSTPIGSFVHLQAPIPERCEPPHNPLEVQTVTGVIYQNGIPGYVYGGTNAISFSNTIDMELVDVTIHFKRPPKVEFDLSETSPELERRVLIRQWRNDFTYFSSAQATLPPSANASDRRIRIAGTLRDEDGPVANRTVYLRSVDPPDVAPYVPVASRRTNDNVAGAGLLANTTVTSDANGRFETVLTVTHFASGDNYQIEGSVLPNFGGKVACDETNVCSKSGVLTAWKRVFLEVGHMFKRGAYLRLSAQAGDSVVEVDDILPFQTGMRIALLHGPSMPRMTPPLPDAEYALVHNTIKDIEKAPAGAAGRLQLTDPLPRPFNGPDASNRPPSLTTDFVGVLTPNPSDDFYEPNLAYIQTLFQDAFVDYVILPAAPVPFVKTIQEVTTSPAPADELHGYAKRWFRHYGLLNHQYVFGSREGSSAASKDARGTTRAIEGFSYSHVMVQKILGVLGTANSRRLLGEVTAHEVAHQWHTNRWSSHTTNGSHCANFSYYDDPTKKCLMFYDYGSLPEFYDDIVRFHYVSSPAGVDSEYRWIRERCEPVPRIALLAPLDWWALAAPPCR